MADYISLGSFNSVKSIDIDKQDIEKLSSKQQGELKVKGVSYIVSVNDTKVEVKRKSNKTTILKKTSDFFSHRIGESSLSSRTVRIQNILQSSLTASAAVSGGAETVTTTHFAKSSLIEWVRNMYDFYDQNRDDLSVKDKSLAMDDIASKAYEYYCSDIPVEVPLLTPEAQKGFVKVIKHIAKEYPDEFQIELQRLGRPIKQGKVNPLEIQEFAFRFMPVNERLNSSDRGARITVNIKPEAAPGLAKVLAKLVADPDYSDIVLQAKILGPEKQGTRTDSAIIYMKPDYKNAEKVALYLAQATELEPTDFIEHTPAGMSSITTSDLNLAGISYAETWETGNYQDTSHGKRRARIVSEAVMCLVDKLGSDITPSTADIEAALSSILKKDGFDLNNPALLAEVRPEI